MTTLSTKPAIINGKKVTIETIFNPITRGISYKVDGKKLTSNSFWNLSPKFKG